MGRLEGKTALVTGGASGIGEAICRRLSQEGAWVAVADLNEIKGVKLARELGKGSLFVKLDVTQEAEWQTAIETVTSQFGGLDILVNNAGMMKPGTIEDATLADWRSAMTVNGEGVFLGCKAAIGSMKTRGADQAPAAIVNVASIAGQTGSDPRAADARGLQRHQGRRADAVEVRSRPLRARRLPHPHQLRAARRDRHGTPARQHQARPNRGRLFHRI